jgi:hypothetical protein
MGILARRVRGPVGGAWSCVTTWPVRLTCQTPASANVSKSGLFQTYPSYRARPVGDQCDLMEAAHWHIARATLAAVDGTTAEAGLRAGLMSISFMARQRIVYLRLQGRADPVPYAKPL